MHFPKALFLAQVFVVCAEANNEGDGKRPCIYPGM